MDWDQTFRVGSAIIASVGGSGAIVLGLSSWLGKLWAERLMARNRDRFNMEITMLRWQFDRELESYRTRAKVLLAQSERYDTRQFELYGTLWAALYDLKVAADKLWESAARETLIDFSTQLRTTNAAVHRGSLFLEESHYQQLKLILDLFGQFEIGKERLIDIRSASQLEDVYVPHIANQQIEMNRRSKQDYDDLIERIRSGFVRQLRESESRLAELDGALNRRSDV